jgi:hypothetical protein
MGSLGGSVTRIAVSMPSANQRKLRGRGHDDVFDSRDDTLVICKEQRMPEPRSNGS